MAIHLVVFPIAGGPRAEGVQLTPADYAYLLSQGVPRDSYVIQKMSPRELYRLHQLINDERTQSDPQSRSDAVKKALSEFQGNQQWERENPGQLWDTKKLAPDNNTRN